MRVLVIAPHADDETFGVGGTIARLASEGHDVRVAVMTGPGPGEHPVFRRETWDVVRTEARKACEVLGVRELIFKEIPAVLVPEEPVWRVNREALEVIEEARADTLFVPFPFDLHRDHRELFYAAWVGARPNREAGAGIREIYAYEVPGETHWNPSYVEAGFHPNVWVDITAHLQTKLEALACYESQVLPFPHFRSVEAVEALARLRGAQMSMEAAEAFVLLRRLLP